MKVALVLHGLFNSNYDKNSLGLDGYKHIEKNILLNHDVDVYAHSWDIEKKNTILELYKPFKFEFEEQKKYDIEINKNFLNNVKNPPRPPHAILSHFYSIQKAMNLIGERWNDYDCIIKSRYDLGRINRNTSGPMFNQKYPVQCINLLKNIESDKFYRAEWSDRLEAQGPPDMWFYGSPTVMEFFMKIYDTLISEVVYDSIINTDYYKYIENFKLDFLSSVSYYKFLIHKYNLKEVKLQGTWE